MSGSRPLWRALGWGRDPWWDVSGRTARRRARRRLLDLALALTAAALVAGTVGGNAQAAGVPIAVDDWALLVPLAEPAGLGTVGPWVATLGALLIGLVAASRRRTRR